MRKVLYIDVEWANSQNKSICQIGLISEDLDTGETILPELNLYVNPEDNYDDNCIAVHHITNEKTKNCKTFKDLWPSIEEYFTKSIIVGHNVCSSDLNAVVRNLKRYSIDIPEIYYIDTYELSRKFVSSIDVKDYKLTTLCKYFDIILDNNHDAFADARACSKLLKALISNYNFVLNDYIEHYDLNDIKDFIPYVSSIEFKRELNTLYGILSGIQIDNIINKKEVDYIKSWKEKHLNFIHYKSVSHIIKVIDLILEDNIITADEVLLLNSVITDYLQYVKSSKETLATQFLQGLIRGIGADKAINDTEIYKLRNWLYKNNYLQGHYPYDLLFTEINSILEDGIITLEEKSNLSKTFKTILEPIENLNNEIVLFENNTFCLSGNFSYGSKNKVMQYIISKGGIVDKNIKKSTNFLVVGEGGSSHYSNGNYGTKIKRAKELNIIIIKENQLFAQ